MTKKMQNENDNSTLKIPEPAPTFQKITDVDELVNNYEKEHYFKPTKRAFLILLVLDILLFAYLILTSQYNYLFLGVISLFLLPIPNAIEISHVVKLKTRLKHLFVQQFSQAKNLSYQAEGQIQNLKGEIFTIYNDKPHYLDIISGAYNKIPFSIFTYEYTFNSRNGGTVIDQTVARLEFSDPLPHLFLQSHKHSFEMLRFCNGDNPQAHLDGNLDNSFTLWTLQGMQLEGLQIFTAEFTQPLADKWNDWHIEFIDNYIYFYPYKLLEKWSDLERMLELAEYFATKLPSVTKEMKSDVEAVESYKNI